MIYFSILKGAQMLTIYSINSSGISLFIFLKIAVLQFVLYSDPPISWEHIYLNKFIQLVNYFKID